MPAVKTQVMQRKSTIVLVSSNLKSSSFKALSLTFRSSRRISSLHIWSEGTGVYTIFFLTNELVKSALATTKSLLILLKVFPIKVRLSFLDMVARYLMLGLELDKSVWVNFTNLLVIIVLGWGQSDSGSIRYRCVV